MRAAALAAVQVLALRCAHQVLPHRNGWAVPGQPGLQMAFVERPPAGAAYGRQLIAIRDGRQVLHESARLYDADFVVPKFFEAAGRTLMLADFGSEDNWGVLAWSFEQGTVRDLGTLEVALSEEEDGFTRGAAAAATVDVVAGAYVITIPDRCCSTPAAGTNGCWRRRGRWSRSTR